MGNVLEDYSVDNVKKTGLYREIYDISGNYYIIDVDDVLEIQKCLMKKLDTK